MNWKRWMSMGIAVAFVVCLSNLDMVRAAEDTDTATAYLYFTDGENDDVDYRYPGGDNWTKTIAQDVQIAGDGSYHLALDFTQTSAQHSTKCTCAKICIVDGETVLGSDSIISIQKVTVNGIALSPSQEGFTASETDWWNPMLQKKTENTIFYLYDYNASSDIYSIQGDREEGAQRTAKDLNPFPDFGLWNIEKLEVDFCFSVNGVLDSSESPDPNESPDFSESPDPNESPDSSESPNPNETPDPGEPSDSNESPDPGKTSNPSETLNPNETPSPDGSSDPTVTPVPNTGGSTNSGLLSNSTYIGAEKILVQTNSVIIPAGGNSTVTFALLRSASSGTQVTVSSGNTGIASPVLQSDGKVRINVPGSAAAGGSTTITLRFGSSTATIKVSVRNAVTKIKATKKSYQVKRKKKTKIVFNLTTQNKTKVTTDVPIVKISGKRASVSSVKIAGSKLTVTVKGAKKGSASLKATVGGKTAKTKIKVK